MIPRDPGLQPQRTALAWVRTGLAVFVNALLVLRAGVQAERPALVALGVVLLAATVSCVVCGVWRGNHLATHRGLSAPPWILIASTVCLAWIACAGGILSIVATLPGD
jgi:hypothetical protein